MKWPIYVVGVITLLLGAFYGFASSPNYHKILLYCVILEVLAFAIFGFLCFKENGWCRIGPLAGLVLSGYTLIQAIIRLVNM